MVGGIPEVMAKAISDRITHSYYLVFGREMDDQGELKRVWVEVELPNTAEFCFWENPIRNYLHRKKNPKLQAKIIATDHSPLES
jgi:hypothetical protein